MAIDGETVLDQFFKFGNKRPLSPGWSLVGSGLGKPAVSSRSLEFARSVLRKRRWRLSLPDIGAADVRADAVYGPDETFGHFVL